MTCTRCQCTGFINIHQVPDNIRKVFDETGDCEVILNWISDQKTNGEDNDVMICDCCGNTVEWYNVPGEHDPHDFGQQGPYDYNGGLPECY